MYIRVGRGGWCARCKRGGERTRRKREGARSLDRGHHLGASGRGEELDALAASKANCMESRHRAMHLNGPNAGNVAKKPSAGFRSCLDRKGPVLHHRNIRIEALALLVNPFPLRVPAVERNTVQGGEFARESISPAIKCTVQSTGNQGWRFRDGIEDLGTREYTLRALLDPRCSRFHRFHNLFPSNRVSP